MLCVCVCRVSWVVLICAQTNPVFCLSLVQALQATHAPRPPRWPENCGHWGMRKMHTPIRNVAGAIAPSRRSVLVFRYIPLTNVPSLQVSALAEQGYPNRWKILGEAAR